jgi:hypothetical protein
MTQDTTALDKVRRALLSEFRPWLNLGIMAEEIVAAMHPDWTRATRDQRGYDFTTPEGHRVQVKGWGTPRRTNDKLHNNADRLVRIQFSDDRQRKVVTDLELVFPDGAASMIVGLHRPATPRSSAKVAAPITIIPSPMAAQAKVAKPEAA